MIARLTRWIERINNALFGGTLNDYTCDRGPARKPIDRG